MRSKLNNPFEKKISMVVWNNFLNDARVLKEANTLQCAGYSVTVFAIQTSIEIQKYEKLSCGVKVVRVPSTPFLLLRTKLKTARTKATKVVFQGSRPLANSNKSRQLYKILSRGLAHINLLLRIIFSRPNVVHAHDVNTLLTAWTASKILRVPLVYDAHEVSTGREGYSGYRWLVALLERKIMPKTAINITTTAMRAKFFRRAYKIETPIVLQNRPLLSNEKKQNRIREELGLTEKWPIVLYQGGLQQGRGLEKLVRIFAEIPDAYFVLIGGGRLEKLLISIAEQYSISSRVKFISTVPLCELPSYTASADIGLQPIENTCFNHFSTDSNKVFEYMMADLPVVATNFPEIRNVVQENNFGFVVSEDESAIRHALQRLIYSNELRCELAKNACLAKYHLSWERQEHLLSDAYKLLF